MLLPGAGAIEMKCIQKLTEVAVDREEHSNVKQQTLWQLEDPSLYDAQIFRTFAECLQDMLYITLSNSGMAFTTACSIINSCKNSSLASAPLSCLQDEQDLDVWDDMLGKVGALKRAVDLCHLLLQSDSLIVNKVL